MGKPAKQDDKKKSQAGKQEHLTAPLTAEPSTPQIVTTAKDEQPVIVTSTNDHQIEVESTAKVTTEITIEPVNEIKYKEPELTYIIVERYEGEKFRGLFEGYGNAHYYDGNLYEGDFHEGMMHGRGKYTWSNGTIYEGDFVNNEITGTGVYLWPDRGGAIYEGEVYQGKRHGFGVFKSLTHGLVYTGEWFSGKRHGKGKIQYDADGVSFYEGDWIDNKKFGWGLRRYPSGNIYEGMWVNDVRHGVGTMRWIDRNQTYIGHWENGSQNGMGEHHWYLQRILSTQYSLRNTYYGMFKNGKRHGSGTFSYANGSKYEGDWCDNLKHGFGKYTSKDGKLYEGWFEDDKMTQNPSFKRTSKYAHDIARVETRIPSAGVTLDLESLNKIDVMEQKFEESFLDLHDLIDNIPLKKQTLERDQAEKTIRRHLERLTTIYRFYSQLGLDSSPDNTYVLSRLQFWRFMKDCLFHVENRSLCEFDRLTNPYLNAHELHNPFDKILMREFLNYLVILAYSMYADELEDQVEFLMASCVEKLMDEKVLPNACNVKGIFYKDTRKTSIALNYMMKSNEIYKFVSTRRTREPHDFTLQMRDFIYLLNEYKLIGATSLSTKHVVSILASDNSNVHDSTNGTYNLEFEMCFLEFFEALVGCALNFAHDQSSCVALPPHKQSRQSTILTREQSFLSQASCKTTAQAHADEQQSKEQLANKKSGKDLSKISSENEDTTLRHDENVLANKHLNVQESKAKTRSIVHTEKDDDVWLRKLEVFFMDKFFPAADYSQFMKCEIKKSL